LGETIWEISDEIAGVNMSRFLIRKGVLAVIAGLCVIFMVATPAMAGSVDKAKNYCKEAGFSAKKCKSCGKKNSKKCQCCYKMKPFWCPRGLAKAPTSYGLYKVCIKGKKSDAAKRDLKKVTNAISTMNPASITKAYDLYFAWVASGVTEKKQKLKKAVVRKFQKYYKFDLTTVKIGESKRTTGSKKGALIAMTNCKSIWFPKGAGMVKKIQKGSMDDGEIYWFAHELQHVEQCFQKGGKRNYAKMWFGQAPTTWLKLILNGKPNDVKKGGLHDAMPMEKDAESKGKQVQDAL
jgi:hypothetical protein